MILGFGGCRDGMGWDGAGFGCFWDGDSIPDHLDGVGCVMVSKRIDSSCCKSRISQEVISLLFSKCLSRE